MQSSNEVHNLPKHPTGLQQWHIKALNLAQVSSYHHNLTWRPTHYRTKYSRLYSAEKCDTPLEVPNIRSGACHRIIHGSVKEHVVGCPDVLLDFGYWDTHATLSECSVPRYIRPYPCRNTLVLIDTIGLRDETRRQSMQTSILQLGGHAIKCGKNL